MHHNSTNARLKKNHLPPIPFKPANNPRYIPSCYKIKLLPTSAQKRILNDNIAAYRKIWNVCLYYIITKKPEINNIALRNRFVIAKNMDPKIKETLEWTFRTAKRIREYAIKDLVSSYKGGFTKLKKKQIKQFKMNFKNKTDKQQTICIPHEGSRIKDGHLRFCSMNIKMDELFPDEPKLSHNMRLSRIDGTYYIFIPKFKRFNEVEETESPKSVSLDLGGNIFATYFSPDEEWGEIGRYMKSRLERYYNKELMIKQRFVDDKPKRNRLLRKFKEKITHLIDDFHWKTVHWLLQRYGVILVSRLYVPKQGDKLKRYMNDLRHCLFVDRLEYKSMFYRGRVIHEGKEHYTSSTCTNCGSMKITKGTTVKCTECNADIHRDLTGARNFFIKHAVLH